MDRKSIQTSCSRAELVIVDISAFSGIAFMRMHLSHDLHLPQYQRPLGARKTVALQCGGYFVNPNDLPRHGVPPLLVPGDLTEKKQLLPLKALFIIDDAVEHTIDNSEFINITHVDLCFPA